MLVNTFLVSREDLQKGRFAATSLDVLKPGDVLAKVDRFAFTANNVTYAETGVVLKYWQFFPAPTGWGIIPVWGYADVVDSRHDGIKPGERLYGYWPMATHVVLRPGRITEQSVVDDSAHRRELPGTYNAYRRTTN